MRINMGKTHVAWSVNRVSTCNWPPVTFPPFPFSAPKPFSHCCQWPFLYLVYHSPSRPCLLYLFFFPKLSANINNIWHEYVLGYWHNKKIFLNYFWNLCKAYWARETCRLCELWWTRELLSTCELVLHFMESICEQCLWIEKRLFGNTIEDVF